MDQDTQTQTAGTEPAASVMQRKTRTGNAVRQAQTVNVPKALRITLAKVADSLLKMPMAVIGARSETVAAEDLGAVFGDDDLLMLFDGKRMQRGAVVCDLALVSALIQQQTMGKVLPPFEGDSRKMTSTDAAISAPFVEALMRRAAPLPDSAEHRQLLEGYTFGARVPESRLLLLALEEETYEVVYLTVDISGGVVQGKITLCLPILGDEARLLDPDAKPGADGEARAPAKPSLEKTVLGLRAELNVALTSLRLPLSAVQNLVVGDQFDLGTTAFDKATVQTIAGRKLSHGVLGQLDGVRALQVVHANAGLAHPRRRISDKEELNLPSVSGDGTGTRTSGWEPEAPAQDVAMGGLPDLPGDDGGLDLPDMGGLDDLPDLPALDDMGGLADLDGLPDMSDLPSFDDDDMPSLKIG